MRYIFLNLAILVVFGVLSNADNVQQNELEIYDLEYSPTGQWVAGVGNHIVIWDATNGVELVRFELDSQSSYTLAFDAAWNPSGDQLAIATTDRIIHVRNFSENAQIFGEQIAQFELTTFMDVRNIDWSPDGSRIIVSGENQGVMEVWDGLNYQFLGTIAGGSFRLQWNPNPDLELIAITDGATSGARLININGHPDGVQTTLCADCSPDSVAVPIDWNSDGTLLAIGHSDGSISVVDVDTSEIFSQMTASDWVSVLQWSYDDLYLASVSGGNLQIWHSATGDLLVDAGFATQMDFNPTRNELFVFDARDQIAKILTLSALISDDSNGNMSSD